MKKVFVLGFVMFEVLAAHAQQNPKARFTLTGKVVNQQDGWVYLSYADKDGNYIRDSSALKNGSFQFQGAVAEPTMAYFNGKVTSRSVDDPNSTSLFLEPANMHITASPNEFKSARITGSKTQAEYEALQKPIHIIRDRWKVVMDTLTEVNKRSNFEFQELKDWVLKPYNAEIKEIELDFINRHPASYASAYTLRFLGRELSTDSLRKFYDRFPRKLKNSSFGKTIAADIEKRKVGIPGTLANDFVTTEVNGEKIGLADFKGKYVLLDFWASWCLPCRKESPHLKELYSKYKPNGFEVIGVASDDGHEDKWRNAIMQDQVGIWKHVLNGYDRAKNKKGIGDSFNISELPTQILVDPHGMIIGRYSEGPAEVEALNKKLKEVFKAE